MLGLTTGINGAISREGNMRKRLWTIPVVVIAALALMGTNAGATARSAGAAATAQGASSCANERVAVGSGGEVFYAFTLHGIACAKAHALITAYSHRISLGRGCEGRGTACGYEVSGSWCSLPGYAGAPFDAGCCENGGRPFGSCTPHGGSFSVRATSPPPGWRAQLHLSQFETPDGRVSCESGSVGPKGYTRCSVSSRNEFAVPAAWMEAPRVRACTHREELVQPEGEGSACPALELDSRVILAYGQENDVGGIRCVVAPEGVTCTFAAGTEAGKGFRINSSEVVQLG
jgi:hypothetical protein